MGDSPAVPLDPFEGGSTEQRGGKGQCANTQTFTPSWCRRAQGLGTFLGNKWEKAFWHQYTGVTGGLEKTMFEIKMLSSL